MLKKKQGTQLEAPEWKIRRPYFASNAAEQRGQSDKSCSAYSDGKKPYEQDLEALLKDTLTKRESRKNKYLLNPRQFILSQLQEYPSAPDEVGIECQSILEQKVEQRISKMPLPQPVKRESWSGDPALAPIVKFNKDAGTVVSTILEVEQVAKNLQKGRECLHGEGYVCDKLDDIKMHQEGTISANERTLNTLDEMTELCRKMVALKQETKDMSRPVVIPPGMKVEPRYQKTSRLISQLEKKVFAKRIEV